MPTPFDLIEGIVGQLERCAVSLPEDVREFVHYTIQLGLNPPVEAAAVLPHRILVGDDGALRVICDLRAPEYRPDARRQDRKRWAASQIFILFYKYSDTPPTNSPWESPFWIATQMLNEAMGGDPGEDVTRACRAVLADNNKDGLQKWWSSRTHPTK
jgi:hypothetical protein